jgi:hypothetical protein
MIWKRRRSLMKKKSKMNRILKSRTWRANLKNRNQRSMSQTRKLSRINK